MLLTSLTPDELERLAFVEPARPGVAGAMAQVARRELEDARDEIAWLEETEDRLRKEIDELEQESFDG